MREKIDRGAKAERFYGITDFKKKFSPTVTIEALKVLNNVGLVDFKRNLLQGS